MKIFGQLIVVSLLAGIVLGGCNNKSTPLVPNKTGTESTTGETAPSTTGDATDVALADPSAPGGTTPSTGIPTPGSTPANPTQTENPSIDSSGKIIQHEDGRPAPAGRVWCENCKGHLPKEDAVSKNGKTYCPACAVELKL